MGFENRKREIAGRRSRLVNAGRRCGSLVSNRDALSLSQQLFDLAERLETRAAVIEKIRIDFADFAAKSSPQEVAMLGEAAGELICTIITTSLQGMIDKVVLSEGRILSLFFSVLKLTPSKDLSKLSMSIVGPAFDVNALGLAQRSLVLALAEKIWKVSDSRVVVSILEHVEAIVLAEKVDLTELIADGPSMVGSTGLLTQPFIDLYFQCVCGQALRLQQSGEVPTPSFRKTCALLVTNSQKVSPRLKTNFRHLCGSASLGKCAWDFVTELRNGYTAGAELLDEANFDVILALVLNIEAIAQKGDWGDAFDSLVDLLNDGKSLLLYQRLGQNFGKSHGDARAPEGDQDVDVEPFKLAHRFAVALVGAVSLVLSHLGDSHTSWFSDTIGDKLLDADYVDEATQLASWLELVFELIIEFPTICPGLVKEARQRTSIILALGKAQALGDGADEPVAKITMWANVWKSVGVVVQSSDQLKPDDAAYEIEAYVAKLRASQRLAIERKLVSVVEDLVRAGLSTTHPALVECQRLDELLPVTVKYIIEAARLSERISNVYERVHGGKSAGGLVELNDLLGKVFDNLLKVNTCYDCFADFKERVDIVHREWTAALDSLLEKLQCSD